MATWACCACRARGSLQASTAGAGARRHERLPRAPDRRTLRRPEEARVPRPRARPGGPGHPARRALHRRRREHRGGDRQAAERAARRGPGHAGLDPQSRLRAGVLRPRRADQPHRARRGPTGEVFTQANLEAAFGGELRHFVLGGTALHDDEDRRSVTVLTDDERPLVFYGRQAKATHVTRSKRRNRSGHASCTARRCSSPSPTATWSTPSGSAALVGGVCALPLLLPDAEGLVADRRRALPRDRARRRRRLHARPAVRRRRLLRRASWPPRRCSSSSSAPGSSKTPSSG